MPETDLNDPNLASDGSAEPLKTVVARDEVVKTPVLGDTATKRSHRTSVGMPRVKGDFRPERKLGEGGFGEVWLAQEWVDGRCLRRVAIKFLHGDTDGKGAVNELLDEVESTYLEESLHRDFNTARLAGDIVQDSLDDTLTLAQNWARAEPILTAFEKRDSATLNRLLYDLVFAQTRFRSPDCSNTIVRGAGVYDHEGYCLAQIIVDENDRPQFAQSVPEIASILWYWRDWFNVTGHFPSKLMDNEKARDDRVGHDLKYAELISKIYASHHRVAALQRKGDALARFLSPTLRQALANREIGDALRERQASVTVLFCDLRGSTRISEEGAADLGDLWKRISGALSIMTCAIVDQEGVIGDFQGDAAMGFWGWPLETPDQAERAARRSGDPPRFSSRRRPTRAPTQWLRLRCRHCPGTGHRGGSGNALIVKH